MSTAPAGGRPGVFPQPSQVFLQRVGMAAVGAQGLECADAAQEAQVEDADGGLGRGDDAAVDGEEVGGHGSAGRMRSWAGSATRRAKSRWLKVTMRALWRRAARTCSAS